MYKLTNMKKKKNKTAREKNSTAEYSLVEKKVMKKMVIGCNI